MLLFIEGTLELELEDDAFIILIVSIHLMLLFIQRETEVICSEVPVSIHLMLLFIEVSGVGSAVVEAFQYISCYSLSKDIILNLTKKQYVSIHLMLLFICAAAAPYGRFL